MTIVCEVAFAAAHAADAAAPHHAPADLAQHWTQMPDLQSLDIYTPVAGGIHDPYVHDGPAPNALAMLAFASLDALDRAVRSTPFMAGLSAIKPAVFACTAMRRSDHPIAEEAAPAKLVAPFAYVVRYHRPAADEAAFVQNYIDTHPPLLGRLPGIRNVMCYVPLPWRDPTGLPSADYLIGNEVAFDHPDAFNAAMASPLRDELRAHYCALPAYSGHNTHFPMRRTRLFG